MGDSISNETDIQSKEYKQMQLLKDLLDRIANWKIKIRTLKKIIVISFIIIILGLLSVIALRIYNIIY